MIAFILVTLMAMAGQMSDVERACESIEGDYAIAMSMDGKAVLCSTDDEQGEEWVSLESDEQDETIEGSN